MICLFILLQLRPELEKYMEKNKHMDLDARYLIQHGLDKKQSFKAIAAVTGKDCTTISKEVRNHFLFLRKGAPYYPFNDCANRSHCMHQGDLCPECTINSHRKCCHCSVICSSLCHDYQKEVCVLLNKPPYVCNGCSKLNRCTLEKHMYDAIAAQKEYTSVLSESRSGLNLTENEIQELDSVISPLMKAGQSLHHIIVNNSDRINCCEKSAYAYLDCGIFSARNIDAPRKVHFRPRKNKSIPVKVDRSCRINRSYQAYLHFLEEHPGINVVELDSVEGVKGGAVLLTVHFVRQKFQLAFRRNHNDSRSVTDIFHGLYRLFGKEKYKELFPVLLADNGTEFSDPAALEFNEEGEQVSHVFYCDPSAPAQKGSCEVNHEFIRRIIPKGVDISLYSQEQITLMMSHINSYSRPDLGDKSPYSLFRFYFGSTVTDRLGIQFIRPNDIILRPQLLKH